MSLNGVALTISEWFAKPSVVQHPRSNEPSSSAAKSSPLNEIAVPPVGAETVWVTLPASSVARKVIVRDASDRRLPDAVRDVLQDLTQEIDGLNDRIRRIDNEP